MKTSWHLSAVVLAFLTWLLWRFNQKSPRGTGVEETVVVGASGVVV